MEPPRIRPAEAADLPAAHEIFHAALTDGAEAPPPRGPLPPILEHVLATGTMVVAEGGGEVVGFAAAVRRGPVAYLTDLFVDPARQSAGVGRALLDRLLPPAAARWTLATVDPRALSLYARAGMAPRWPNVELRLEAETTGALADAGVEAVAADPTDPALAAWDAEIAGRPRPEDTAYWLGRCRGVPLWFRRAGCTVGYGVVQREVRTVWTPRKIVVGPIGARTAADAAACVLAAVAWALPHGPIVDVAVPGPHPALAPLLAAGARIIYVETFCASDPSLVDPTRYLGSGSELF